MKIVSLFIQRDVDILLDGSLKNQKKTKAMRRWSSKKILWQNLYHIPHIINAPPLIEMFIKSLFF